MFLHIVLTLGTCKLHGPLHMALGNLKQRAVFVFFLRVPTKDLSDNQHLITYEKANDA